MTSRQPGTAPPGTAEAGGRVPGSGQGTDSGHGTAGRARDGSGPWPLVLPLALLIILGMAGLRGAVTRPRWNGPLYHDGLAIGLALEVVLGVLLAVTLRRRAASLRTEEVNEAAAKLRTALIFVLGAGMIAVLVAIVDTLHLRVTIPLHNHSNRAPPPPVQRASEPLHGGGFQVPLTAILYGLLIVALVAAVVFTVWWSRRFRLPGVPGKNDGLIAEDPEDLREAVESGRSALRALDDARAAIIACYVAMETSLAERGAARAAADTPDELLARATRTGVVHGTAAARLTALFYEARFSSHPLGRGQRDAAERALDELAAALSGAEPAGAGA